MFQHVPGGNPGNLPSGAPAKPVQAVAKRPRGGRNLAVFVTFRAGSMRFSKNMVRNVASCLCRSRWIQLIENGFHCQLIFEIFFQFPVFNAFCWE
jgi:hypothetical protein